MQENEHGHVHLQSVNPLYATTQSRASNVAIIEEEYANLPSPHITPAFVAILAKDINQKILTDEITGVVITHGTDTLEETAYLLDLLLDCEIPIVLTGAMRSSNELGADGPFNFANALQVAVNPTSYGRGVLVTLNGEIHSAAHVTKIDTTNLATFQSPGYGPIGTIIKEQVIFYYANSKKTSYDAERLTKQVALLKAYAGMDRTMIDAVVQTGVDGLVLEAFGQGNVPPAIVPALKELIAKKIPVVLVSRCPSGFVQPTYAYEGGGKTLKDTGIIFVPGLNGQKARLKLMVALEVTTEFNQLRTMLTDF